MVKDVGFIEGQLYQLDCSKATATQEEDLKRIRQQICLSAGGFGVMTKMVREKLGKA